MPMPELDPPYAESFAFLLLIIVAALGIDCAVHREHMPAPAPVPIFQKVCTAYPHGVVVCDCKYGAE
jgi:hypothetical protein